MAGIFRGAATCFYGFIGFDCIATAGEEATDPKRSMPIAIIGSLIVVFLTYFGISTVLTMMLPYFEQDPNAPLTCVFKHYGWHIAVYMVSIGAIFGLCASLMGSMFPLPRIIYAMSNDGLIFKWMGKIHPRFQTPVYGTMFVGTLTGILAAIFDLSQLVHMMSIGTLFAYSIVAACVLLLRYEVEDHDEKLHIPAPFTQNIIRFLWNTDNVRIPTKLTSIIVTWEVTVFCKYFIYDINQILMLPMQTEFIKWSTIFFLILNRCFSSSDGFSCRNIKHSLTKTNYLGLGFVNNCDSICNWNTHTHITATSSTLFRFVCRTIHSMATCHINFN